MPYNEALGLLEALLEVFSKFPWLVKFDLVVLITLISQ